MGGVITLISEEAQKSIKRYSSLGSLIKALYFNPSKDAKIRVMFQRLNYNFALKFNPKLKDANYEELYLGGIRTLKITTPKSDPNKNILYFHGGAYIVGNPEAYKSLVGHLAGITEATIYVPDYRLAPENKFPSQLNDGVECYKALINDLNINPSQIIVGGDSAGGNLSLVTCLKLKELGIEMPSSIICISPWADPEGTGDTYTTEMAEKDILMGPVFKKMWNYGHQSFLYFVDENEYEINDPFISPIYGDYTNFPPVMIQVGSHEILLSDAKRLKEALDKVGCVNEYIEWEGLWHVFQLEVKLPETIKSFNIFSEFIDKHIKAKI